MCRMNFIEACINGEVLYDEIDDYIDYWHEGEYEEEIYEFLGMTEEEYMLWVENENLLKYIIKCHIDNKSISDFLDEIYGNEMLVARAKSPEEAKFIYKWLEKKGKINRG